MAWFLLHIRRAPEIAGHGLRRERGLGVTVACKLDAVGSEECRCRLSDSGAGASLAAGGARYAADSSCSWTSAAVERLLRLLLPGPGGGHGPLLGPVRGWCHGRETAAGAAETVRQACQGGPRQVTMGRDGHGL